VLCRHAQWNPGVADLALRADEPLREGRLGNEERAGDLGRLETADETQRQRDLGLRRERGVAAGEDQLEPLVGDGGLLVVGELLGACEQLRLARERLLAPDPVDRRVAGRRDDPGARIARRSLARPALGRADEGVLYRVLGEIEVTEDAAEDRDRACALVAICAGELFYDATSASRITTGRTSMCP
jgi:hypothetical protein